MRILLLLLLSSVSFSVLAEEAWDDVLSRAQQEKKPIVVLFAPQDCARCRQFERSTLPHPTIQGRLPGVVFGMVRAEGGDPSLAFFDRSGVLRGSWPMVPTTMQLGIIIDSIRAVAPHFERAVQLAES